jgi:two-component system, sensor histidine kinase
MATERLSEEVRAAFDYLPATLAGNVAGVAVIAGLFGGTLPAPSVALWLGAFLLMLMFRAALGLRFRSCWLHQRNGGATQAMDWPRWRLLWNIGTLCSGALWGATAWIFWGAGDSNQQTALVITVYTFCIAAVPVLATQPRVYAAFAALCFVPLIARLVTDGTRHSLELAGILLLIFSLTSVLARSFRDTMSRALDHKLRSDQLLIQLRTEQAAAHAARAEAEEARRVAEAANRAKTQFFAAASHDLRQPLHALGLFAEALRNRKHDRETEPLVGSINASVDALEGLFSQLMDLNRIEAGGMMVAPQGLPLQAVFDKLAVHLAPEAFDKGLALRWRGGHQVVHADPLLLERVLRNLVGNAVRYTADGGVLVAARPRSGGVLLQVWDTGIGIAASDQTRVFDEFFQVGGAAVQAGSARKGMGLGLAIVQRLCAAMQLRLSLRSEPHRGTVFEIQLPRGTVPVAAPTLQPGANWTGQALEGQRAVLVEDDPAVRQGVAALLHAWGMVVECFDGLDSLRGAAAGGALGAVDLAIVDYRLDGAETGLDALSVLERTLGRSVPAVVITGSVSSALEAEAQRLGVPVLTKPVMPARLRAALTACLHAADASIAKA